MNIYQAGYLLSSLLKSLEDPEYLAVEVPRPALGAGAGAAQDPSLRPLYPRRPLRGAVHQPLQQPEHFTF